MMLKEAVAGWISDVISGAIAGCRPLERVAMPLIRRFGNAPLVWRIRTRIPGKLGKSGVAADRWVDIRPGLHMLLDASDVYAVLYHSKADYEASTIEFLLAHLPQGGTFVDVGANQGYFALLAAQAVGAHGTVIAFEPNPTPCQYLRQSIERNGYGARVRVVQAALGDRTEGARPFFVSRLRGNSGISSFIPEWAGHSDATQDASRDALTVECMTFDSWIADHPCSRLDVIKIDAEGWNLNVLKGMTRTLETLAPRHIICETPADGDVARFLAAYGYHATPVPESPNTSFSREDSPAGGPMC